MSIAAMAMRYLFPLLLLLVLGTPSASAKGRFWSYTLTGTAYDKATKDVLRNTALMIGKQLVTTDSLGHYTVTISGVTCDKGTVWQTGGATRRRMASWRCAVRSAVRARPSTATGSSMRSARAASRRARSSGGICTCREGKAGGTLQSTTSCRIIRCSAYNIATHSSSTPVKIHHVV